VEASIAEMGWPTEPPSDASLCTLGAGDLPSVCRCHPCPEGFTSIGGYPEVAACFPTSNTSSADTITQTVEVLFSLKRVDLRRLLDIDPSLYHAKAEPLLETANKVAAAWAEEFSQLSLSDVLGATGQLPAVRLLEPVSAYRPMQTTFVRAKFGFNGSRATEMALRHILRRTVRDSDAFDPEAGCGDIKKQLGVDLCERIFATTPRYHLESFKVLASREDDDHATLLLGRRQLLDYMTEAPTAAPDANQRNKANFNGYFKEKYDKFRSVFKSIKEIFEGAHSIHSMFWAVPASIDKIRTVEGALARARAALAKSPSLNIMGKAVQNLESGNRTCYVRVCYECLLRQQEGGVLVLVLPVNLSR
jgi:hypothetical protein